MRTICREVKRSKREKVRVLKPNLGPWIQKFLFLLQRVYFGFLLFATKSLSTVDQKTNTPKKYSGKIEDNSLCIVRYVLIRKKLNIFQIVLADLLLFTNCFH